MNLYLVEAQDLGSDCLACRERRLVWAESPQEAVDLSIGAFHPEDKIDYVYAIPPIQETWHNDVMRFGDCTQWAVRHDPETGKYIAVT
jgi:hypothetical protein